MAFKRFGPRFISSRSAAAPTLARDSVFEARVQGLSDTGEAVVNHPDGRRFFVPGAWTDEQVRVRVKDVKSQYGLGELLEVLEASPSRITPPCPYQGFAAHQCGGCGWMFVDYPAQVQAKQARVERALARLQPDLRVLPILPAPEPLGYRVRAQLKTDGRELGFVANAQRQLVAVADCQVLTEPNRQTLRDLRARLPEPGWVPRGKQGWTTLDLDETVTAANVSVNKRLPFQQANAIQNRAMQHWLAEKIGALDKTAPVLELFAGSGNFTQVLAAAGFASIIAVEAVPEAVAALVASQMPGVTAVACDLFDEAAVQVLAERCQAVETLVLDPPREGLKVSANLFGKKRRLRDVLYISCDLATLCRDLRMICAERFVIAEVQPVDLFPQTPHVELLVHLRRGKT